MLWQSSAAGDADATALQRRVDRCASLGSTCRLPAGSYRKIPLSSGADHGVFEGDHCEAFTKDLPLDRVPADVLIAYAMNGALLRPENG